jgi:ribosomal protein L28
MYKFLHPPLPLLFITTADLPNFNNESKRKKSLGRTRRKWEDNIQNDSLQGPVLGHYKHCNESAGPWVV